VDLDALLEDIPEFYTVFFETESESRFPCLEPRKTVRSGLVCCAAAIRLVVTTRINPR